MATKFVHGVENSLINAKHNLQWNWQQKISKPLLHSTISIGPLTIRGREDLLDKWHRKMKLEFKKLFKAAFDNEQEELFPKAQADLRAQMEASGSLLKEIDKAVKKLRKAKFKDDDVKCQVSAVRFIKFVKEFVDKELTKSAKLDIHKSDHDLTFVRNNNPIRLLDVHPFFQITDSSEMVSWSQFKDEVFYQYIENRERFLDTTVREKTILKMIDQGWKQLQSEKNKSTDAVTYQQLRERLMSFDHTFDPSFFQQSFWVEKADKPIQEIDQFIKQDCGIQRSLAEIYKMIKDLKQEQETKISEEELKLASDGLDHDEKSVIKSVVLSSVNSNSDNNEHDDPTSQVNAVNSTSNNSNSNNNVNAVNDASNATTTTSSTSTTNDSSNSSSNNNNTNASNQDSKTAGNEQQKPSFLKRIFGGRKYKPNSDDSAKSNQLPNNSQNNNNINPLDEDYGEEQPDDEPILEAPPGYDENPNQPEPEPSAVTHKIAGDPSPAQAITDAVSNLPQQLESQVVDQANQVANQIDSQTAVVINQTVQQVELQLSEIITQEAQTIFQDLSNALQNAVSQSVVLLNKLLLSAQNKLDQVSNQIQTDLSNLLTQQKNHTAGFQLARSATIAARKEEYKAKIASAEDHQNKFESDKSNILKYIRSKYRQSLASARVPQNAQEVAHRFGSWQDAVQKRSQEVSTDPLSLNSKTVSMAAGTKMNSADDGKILAGGDHNENNDSDEKHGDQEEDNDNNVTCKLPVTLENAECFRAKFSETNYVYQVKRQPKCDLPDCVNYSNEMPPCENQELNHPGCIDSVCALKEWQEFKNYGLKERLSRDYLCQKLHAKHDKNPKAVNLQVNCTVFDVLAEINNHGIPTQTEYEHFYKPRKQKAIAWAIEHWARFKTLCARHMFDKILRVEDLIHIKLALARYGPLLCSVPVRNSKSTQFWVAKSKCSEKSAEIKLPFHTMLIVGYSDYTQSFLIRNTCGSEYGDHGFCSVSYNAFFEHEFHAFLCLDHTRPKHCTSWNEQQLPPKKKCRNDQKDCKDQKCDSKDNKECNNDDNKDNKDCSNDEKKCTAGLVEDFMMREARKKAVGALSLQPNTQEFHQFSFQSATLVLPPFIANNNNNGADNPFSLLVPQQTGVAQVGFAGSASVEPWSQTGCQAYFIFVDQRTQYILQDKQNVYTVRIFNRNGANNNNGSPVWTPVDSSASAIFQTQATLTIADSKTDQIMDNQTRQVTLVLDLSSHKLSVKF